MPPRSRWHIFQQKVSSRHCCFQPDKLGKQQAAELYAHLTTHPQADAAENAPDMRPFDTLGAKVCVQFPVVNAK